MNVLLFGATGMVGQGVLRECLLDPEVQLVLTVGRTRTGIENPKLREMLMQDLWQDASIGFDACFFCLGVTSAGLKEAEYERLTYGLTLSVAEALARLNPQMTFVYVSGAGTDSSEQGRIHWARIKGKTENALLRLPFKAAYMFRPGVIQPLHGIQSTKPLLPVLPRLLPNSILTTEQIGRAMLAVVRHSAPKRAWKAGIYGRLADRVGEHADVVIPDLGIPSGDVEAVGLTC
ncbi:MAG: epimerase [Bryobacteraceae bacterium]